MPDNPDLYTYAATVVRWIDGDTVELDVDLGFQITKRERFRLHGVDTPELRPRRAKYETDGQVDEAARADEARRGREALSFVERVAPVGSEVEIRTIKDRQGKFGRYLVEVVGIDGEDVALALIDAGLAVRADY